MSETRKTWILLPWAASLQKSRPGWEDTGAGKKKGGRDRTRKKVLAARGTRLLPTSPPLFFHRDVHVTFMAEDGQLVCVLQELGIERRAPEPELALARVAAAVRTEAAELNQRMTHTLSPEERRRKQTLLGVVDLAASGLLESTSTSTWVIGYPSEIDEERVFIALGNQALHFALEEPLKTKLAADDRLRFAKVRTGTAGEPTGPVVAVEEPLASDQEAAWREWQNRITQDG